jgi:Mg2+ and Co2+ transporter CorA
VHPQARESYISFLVTDTSTKSLFGMNINLLKDNPDWRWFLPIAVTLILMAFGLWLLFDWVGTRIHAGMI